MTEPKRRATPATASHAPVAAAAATEPKKVRARLLQEDVPGYSLDQALRVARAIAENYAYKPTRPMHVAGAMGMSPTSGPFRSITGASVAYGLTTGAAQAPEIGITSLGMRAVRPTAEGEDVAAKREAILKPKVVGEFLRGYDGAAMPNDAIAKNVLQEKGVPAERLDDVLGLIVEGAKAVGFLRDISGRRYVDLAGPAPTAEVEIDTVSRAPAPVAAMPASRGFPVRATAPVAVSVGPGIHINIEIHIAADASSSTIEDIFKNMRRYVLSGDGQSDDGQTNAE